MAKQKPAPQAAEPPANAASDSQASHQYQDLLQEFVSVNQGFPPYFKFEQDGDAIYGKVVGLDASDPEFPRYVVEACLKPITCRKGPVNDSIDVTVEPGEFFTVSAYATLDLEQLLDIPALIIRTAEEPVKSDSKKTKILFEVKVAPNDVKLVKARQKDQLAFQLETSRRTIGAQNAQMVAAS